MTPEQLNNFQKSIGSKTGTEILLHKIIDDAPKTKVKTSIFSKDYIKHFTQIIEKDFRYDSLHSDKNHVLLFNGNEVIKKTNRDLTPESIKEVEISLDLINDKKINDFLKENKIDPKSFPNAKLIIGELKDIDEDEDIDDKVHTRDFGVLVKGINSNNSETLANIIAPPNKNLLSPQNKPYTTRVGGSIEFPLEFLKALQYVSQVGKDFLNITRKKFGENGNKYSKKILDIVGDYYSELVQEIRIREEGIISSDSEDLSIIQKEYIDLDKEISSDEVQGSLAPVDIVQFRPPKIRLNKGQVGRVSGFFKKTFLEDLEDELQVSTLFSKQVSSKDPKIADLQRMEFTETNDGLIKTPKKYVGKYNQSKWNNYKQVSIPIIGIDYGSTEIEFSFKLKMDP